MARVSVITIVLNGEAFLEEAIASVCAQQFDDWQLLIVDDGSTDGSLEIARAYERRHPSRIRSLQHPDGLTHGMSATRNLGIEKSEGEYVAFLDADDVWSSEKLRDQVDILDRYAGAGMVYGRTLIWHSWRSDPAERDFFYDLGVPPDALYGPPLLFKQLLQNEHQSPTTCNAMVRRSAADNVGCFDAQFRDMFEDQLFFAKMLLCYPAYVSGQCWAKYRIHEASASAQHSDPARVARKHARYVGSLRKFVSERCGKLSHERIAVEATLAGIQVERLRRRVRAWVRPRSIK